MLIYYINFSGLEFILLDVLSNVFFFISIIWRAGLNAEGVEASEQGRLAAVVVIPEVY